MTDRARSRPPPARPEPATALPLVGRAAMTDRAARFDERFEVVAGAHARREQRRRQVTAAVGSVASATAVGIGFALGGAAGLAAAVGVTAAGWGASRVAARGARRRGATAWDWQAQRYRLLGRPADRVQALDRHKEQPLR